MARKSAARLAAVQAVYQMIICDQGADEARADQLAVRNHPDFELDFLSGPDGAGSKNKLVAPDQEMLERITHGVAQNRQALDTMIAAHSVRSHIDDMDDKEVADTDKKAKKTEARDRVEPLLQAVLLCGAYELVHHPEIDPPIVISDYLDVTHAFFEPGSAALVNGVLDSLRKSLV